jgi:hypothetical protein
MTIKSDKRGIRVNNQENNVENGSSLIAMAMMIIVIGVMITGFLFIYQNQELINRDQETVRKNTTISAALKDYLMKYGRVPCPAPFTAPRDTGNFGVEDPTRDCDSPTYYNFFLTVSLPNFPFRGIYRVSPLPQCPTVASTCTAAVNCRCGPPPGNIKIGTLPVRSLNLADDFIIDGYGKRYIYAVTENLAIDGTSPNLDLGAINVVDLDGNSLPSQRGHAKYIFFSPGTDDRGAFDMEGARLSGCDFGDPIASENCDYQSNTVANRDATFISSFFKTY